MSNQPQQITPLSEEDQKLAKELMQNYKGNVMSILSNLQQVSANALDELINDRVVLGSQVRQLSQETQSQKAIIENLTKEITIIKNQGNGKPALIPKPVLLPEPTTKA